jgi:DNA-binding NarL/FixJ family response regulator
LLKLVALPPESRPVPSQVAGEGILSPEDWIFLVGAKFKLSRRELEMARLLVQGEKRYACARKLRISLDTAKHYIHTLYRKLGVRDRCEFLLKIMALRRDR